MLHETLINENYFKIFIDKNLMIKIKHASIILMEVIFVENM